MISANLALANTDEKHVPTLVPGLTNVVQLTVGDEHSCALLKDGTLRCWGENFSGEVGNGTLGDDGVLSPVAVKELTDVVEVSGGSRTTCARLSTGQVSCWGLNWNGALGGGGTEVFSSYPVTVKGLPADIVEVDAARVGAACARSTNGTLFCWGTNFQGQVGIGSMDDQSTAVAVSGPTLFTQVTVQDTYTCAVSADGLPWCWGSNNYLLGYEGNNPNSYLVPTVVNW